MPSHKRTNKIRKKLEDKIVRKVEINGVAYTVTIAIVTDRWSRYRDPARTLAPRAIKLLKEWPDQVPAGTAELCVAETGLERGRREDPRITIVCFDKDGKDFDSFDVPHPDFGLKFKF